MNRATGQVYVANYNTGNVSAIATQQIQTIPITSTITALAGNQTTNFTPAVNFTASNTFTSGPVNNLFYQVDGWQGTWTNATNNGSGAFSATLASLVPGFHMLYAYSTDGEAATSTITGLQASPLIGNIAAYGFVVMPTGASFTPPSLSFGNEPVTVPSTLRASRFSTARPARRLPSAFLLADRILETSAKRQMHRHVPRARRPTGAEFLLHHRCYVYPDRSWQQNSHTDHQQQFERCTGIPHTRLTSPASALETLSPARSRGRRLGRFLTARRSAGNSTQPLAATARRSLAPSSTSPPAGTVFGARAQGRLCRSRLTPTDTARPQERHAGGSDHREQGAFDGYGEQCDAGLRFGQPHIYGEL